MDFPIRITPLFTLLLWPFGARGPNAVVSLVADRMHLQFGALFDHPLHCSDLYVSLEDPAGFLTASEVALDSAQARGESAISFRACSPQVVR